MNPTEVSPIHIDTLLALLLVASATAVIIKWVRVPYAVALVIAGLAIGLSKVLQPVSMTPDLVLLIFLPALLFEASWNMDIKALRRDWLSIGILATVGVAVCMFGVAAILHFAGGMSTSTALLFGAMVSATDPVSVIALFRQMGIDKRLTMIIEGESLFNDGTAVVAFKIVLAILLSGAKFSALATTGNFLLVVFGGAFLGSVLGYIASKITSAFEDHLLEITLTMVTAYGAFLLAEYFHVSSVIAVVAAGIVVGNYGSRTGMSATTRLAVNSFWEYASFLVNSLLFLLIGLQIQTPLLIKHAQSIGLAVLAVIISRMLVVYGLCPFISTKRLPIPDKWRHLMFWGGLRGALVMALALSLPLTFPDREAVINMTFGVVLFTLLVPGLTIEPLVRLLGMAPTKEKLGKYQENRAIIIAYENELSVIDKLYEEKRISEASFTKWKEQIRHSIEHSRQTIEALQVSDASIEEYQDQQARVYLLQVRRDNLAKLAKDGILTEDAAHHLYLEIDSEIESINEGDAH